MRFVQDYRRIIRQHGAVRAVTQRQVGKKQMMIDDDDVGINRALAHARKKARLEVGTLLSQTGVGARVDVPPEGKILRKIRKLCAIPGLGLRYPAKNFVELIDLIEPLEQRRGLSALEAMQTGVVVAALHHGRAKFCRQDFLKKRDVLIHQLLLQIFGAGRDHYAGAAPARRRDRGHEISERLAGAGAGFDDQVLLLLEGAQHGLSHFDLAGAMLVFRMSFGD